MPRGKEDREYRLEREIELRSQLVELLLASVPSQGISQARKAVREDNLVRSLVTEYNTLSARLDREFDEGPETG